MIKIFKILLLFLIPFVTYSQVSKDKYRLYLSNKQNNNYSTSAPSDFLSEKAIERRARFSIKIEQNDLPVSKYYIDSLKNLGLEIITTSKWLNTVVVYSTDKNLIDTITNLDFIRSKAKCQNKTITVQKSVDLSSEQSSLENHNNDIYYDYGYGTTQISMLKGHALHQNGFQGQGIAIAVIDAGFYNVDLLPAFDSIRNNNQILGTRDFVDGDNQVYDASDHGMKVLSTMASNIPGQLVGTAPKAHYWLLRSEKTDDEYTIEEDYWAAAAEFADSVGSDIITSSLGYSEFDDLNQNYTYADLDGNTTLITKAADIAASKGILVVNSAGNLGNDPWKYISAPADGDSVLAVGAVDAYAKVVSFSGYGPTFDGRIKPNICAMGYKTSVQSVDGSIIYANGTSFSAPIISGMAACLWQSLPELNNYEIIKRIEESSHQYSNPNNTMGYGIPDFEKAAGLESLNTQNPSKDNYINSYPNPFSNQLTIDLLNINDEIISIEIYTSTGVKVKESNKIFLSKFSFSNLESLPSGIYLIKVKTKFQSLTQVVCKVE